MSGLDGASCVNIITPDCTLPSEGVKVAVSSVVASANTVLLVKTAEKAALLLIKLLNVRASVPIFDTTIVMLLCDVDG